MDAKDLKIAELEGMVRSLIYEVNLHRNVIEILCNKKPGLAKRVLAHGTERIRASFDILMNYTLKEERYGKENKPRDL